MSNQHQHCVIIRHPKSGMVLDGTDYEVKLQRFVGNAAQQWRLECTNHGRFFILNKKTGNALDIEWGANTGANLITFPKHGEINQQWHINADGTIECPKDSLVLDTERSEFSPGTNIIAFPKHGDDNQIFQLQSIFIPFFKGNFKCCAIDYF